MKFNRLILLIALALASQVLGFRYHSFFLRSPSATSVPISRNVKNLQLLASDHPDSGTKSPPSPPQAEASQDQQQTQPQPAIPAVKSLFSSIFSLFRSPQTFFCIWLKEASPISDPDLINFFSKALSWGFWILFALSSLGTLGVDTKPLLSLFSVAGITVGFAAKDFLTNSFAGFYVLLTKPFHRGDVISLNGMTGRVKSINLRYVVLEKEEDNTEILIPLSLVFGHAITIIRHSNRYKRPSY